MVMAVGPCPATQPRAERHLVRHPQAWEHRNFADSSSFVWIQQVPQKDLHPPINISSFNLQPWSTQSGLKDKYLALSSLLVGVSLDPAFCIWKSVYRYQTIRIFPLPTLIFRSWI